MKGVVTQLVTTEEKVRLEIGDGGAATAMKALLDVFARLDAGWQVTALDVHFRRQVMSGRNPVRLRPTRRKPR